MAEENSPSGLVSALRERMQKVVDGVEQNLILIFAGGLVSVIAALTMAWIALQAKHDQISQLLARSY